MEGYNSDQKLKAEGNTNIRQMKRGQWMYIDMNELPTEIISKRKWK